MSVADWIILAFLVFSVVGAAMGGFFHEAFKLAGLVMGYLLAAWQYHRLANWFAPYLKSPWFGEIAGFLIIFFAVLILAGFAGRIARWVMKKAGLSTIDRVLGAVLGMLRGVLVVAVVLTVMAAFAPAQKWLAESQLAPYFLVGGRAAVWLAPSELRQRFYQGLDYLRHAPSATEALRPQPATAK
jgi:membrane protein required for colicin V production